MIENNREFLYSIKTNHEQSLWRAVILQAFIDLKSNSKKKLLNTYRVKATFWFNLNNIDFVTVCNYAGLNPYYVWSIAEKYKNINYNKKMIA